MSELLKRSLAGSLHEYGLLQFGEFVLKNGMRSPFYIDIRKAQSYPDVLAAIVDVYEGMISGLDKNILLAGVPEAATPLATATGYQLGRPLVQPRKNLKDYGAKRTVEGEYSAGDRVVVLDDLITGGDSKLEVIEQLEKAGLTVAKLVLLIDRQQGGMETVRRAGYEVEAAFTISEMTDILLEMNKIDTRQYREVIDFIGVEG